MDNPPLSSRRIAIRSRPAYPQAMAQSHLSRKRHMSVKQRWQRLLQTRFWKMDIHPSAWIAPTALIDRTWPRGIHINADCIIDHHAVVLTHDMTRGLYLDTVIGARTRVGARAIILPGVSVGEDCEIAPGALVNKDVPSGSQVMGNPARIVREE